MAQKSTTRLAADSAFYAFLGVLVARNHPVRLLWPACAEDAMTGRKTHAVSAARSSASTRKA
jgi:hypothetical protein